MDWKLLTNLLADKHREYGVALVKHTAFPNRVSINLAEDEDIYVQPGEIVHPRKLRSHLFQHRHSRKFNRPTLVLWSAYNPDEDVSYVGVGAQVTPAVAGRMNCQMLEVPYAEVG